MADIYELIPQYALNKSELDSYKKLCDKENAEIKKLMEEMGETAIESDGYIAKYIVQHRESINEVMLLDILHKDPSVLNVCEEFGIIKTKEYVDFDALESAIYSNALSVDTLLEVDKARETKDVVTLKVTKVKK